MASLLSLRMPKKSPPKHRHDGTSPLPLGMDWSPPPKKWEGRDTVWPHDPRSGWSYCVTIPFWVIRTESRPSERSVTDPVVFYRVQVGIQSPERITFAKGLFRRFSDFLRLFNALKHLFPKKNLPPAPPKHRFMRINSSRALLEERRCALEEWMGKLLSDIDLSRSAPVASFLDLEAAARLSFQDGNRKSSHGTPDANNGGLASWTLQSTTSRVGCESETMRNFLIPADYYGDNICETSDLGTPRQVKDLLSETASDDLLVDQHLTSTSSLGVFFKHGTLDEANGVFTGDPMPEQLEEFPHVKMQSRKGRIVVGSHVIHKSASSELMLDLERGKVVCHTRKLSADSVGSDISSVRGSEISNSGAGNSGENSVDNPEDSDIAGLLVSDDVQMALPLDQRNKMNRFRTIIQRRLVTAKTDMEDLLTRLNQEMAVKEYLMKKVKDLDIELETTNEKSKENLQQAILIKRERVTQMQWDLEDLRRKTMEMESKLKFEQDERILAESAKVSAISEKGKLIQELDMTRKKFEKLQKCNEDLEKKSKSDIKVLVKEVKSLRKTQIELKQEFSQSLKERSELERTLEQENKKSERRKGASEKLLHESKIVRSRLQECTIDFPAGVGDGFAINSSSVSDSWDMLTTSDGRIDLLLAEAQLLAQEDECLGRNQGEESQTDVHIKDDDTRRNTENEVRKMMSDLFVDNAQLRKQANSITRCALKTAQKWEHVTGEGDPPPSRKTVLKRLPER